MSGVDANQAGQTPVDSHAQADETGEVCPKTPSPTDIQERETIAHQVEAIVQAVFEAGERYAKATFGEEPLPLATTMRARDQILALRSNPQPGSEGLTEALNQIGRMKLFPDDKINRTTLQSAIRIAQAARAAAPTPPTAQPGEVERLRSALEFYADPKHWQAIHAGSLPPGQKSYTGSISTGGWTLSISPRYDMPPAIKDNGLTARAALTPSESQSNG